MDIISLPQNLQLPSSPVQIYDYRTDHSCFRSKINLTQNTFSFLIEGTKEVIADGKATAVRGNKFLLIKSGNCLMTETLSTSNRAYRSMLLFFSDEFLMEFLEKNQLDSKPRKKGRSFHICQYDDYIRHFVQSLEKLNQLDRQLRLQLLKAKFEEIMIYLIQQEKSSFLNCLLQNQDSSTLQLVNVVENNKLHKLSLQELSFLCNMSLSTFKRKFFQHYQTTPIKWFQEKRLEHAAFLLSAKKKRPTELFEEAGYDSLSNFVQAFKKKYGATPKQFQLNN